MIFAEINQMIGALRDRDGDKLCMDAADTIEQMKAQAATSAEPVATLLGDPGEWQEKLEELQMWTGSAFLAGESVDDRECKPQLYSFLCGLLGWLDAARQAAELSTPTPVVADRAQSSSPEIPDSSPNCSKSSNGSPEPQANDGRKPAERWADEAYQKMVDRKAGTPSPEPDAVRERLAKALRESALHKSYWSVDDKDLAMRAATALCPLSRPQGEGGGAKA